MDSNGVLRGIISDMDRPIQALVIDDEAQIRNFVSDVLTSENWTVTAVGSAEAAFALLREKTFDLVFCDVVLGQADGYEVLRKFVSEQPRARIVMMTGRGSAAGALDATAIGAFDYLLKPFTVDDIIRISGMVRDQLYASSQRRKKPSEEIPAGYASDIPLIGNSPKFVECLKMVGRVAPSNLPVLITGESGTGKEIVASAIHRRSQRSGGPFVTVNCGAIPVELIESELFGHAKGSFTGAGSEHMGLWEQADGGTIFLDEITETNPLFQVKLLRALQEGEVRRVGSNRTLRLDVRVIAATNRDIEQEVAENRFRQDLMYRLNAVTIRLPPLRERAEDIPALTTHFATKSSLPGASVASFSADAMQMLKSYPWPGNVRELENAVLHAVSMCDRIVYPEHLPERIRQAAASNQQGAEPGFSGEAPTGESDEFVTLAEMEARYAARVLAHSGGNKQAAARILDIDRKTLGRILGRLEK